MTTIEILNSYRSESLELKNKYGDLDDQTRKRLNTLEQVFKDQDLLKYANDCIRIVCLYYKHGMTAEQIAEKLNKSPRTVYRKRDEGIRRLSHFFGE